MLFDSHAHLDDTAFDDDRDTLISSFQANGIGLVMNASSDIKSSEASISLAEKYSFIYAAAGIHPEAAAGANENDEQKLRELLKHQKCVAVGEIGLDYYYNTDSKAKQLIWFEKQLCMAVELDYPVIIHDRDAHDDCLRLVKKRQARGVFHCFSGSAEMAKELVKLGFYISFTGVLTFKNARKAVEAAQIIPLDRLLIETDSPYMAPEPFRGKRNNPCYVEYTARKLAEIKNISYEEIAEITTANAKKLFGIQ